LTIASRNTCSDRTLQTRNNIISGDLGVSNLESRIRKRSRNRCVVYRNEKRDVVSAVFSGANLNPCSNRARANNARNLESGRHSWNTIEHTYMRPIVRICLACLRKCIIFALSLETCNRSLCLQQFAPESFIHLAGQQRANGGHEIRGNYNAQDMKE
jgi:hypothetical protein